ncbi:hypothetical protein [Kaistia adipata]|uniref:hypothetical protein n=1 Tax=Kaistia adipata TaxID=166954 RepID=UPI0012EC4E47|nr:hypothetical protein [Kaistia adipata]
MRMIVLAVAFATLAAVPAPALAANQDHMITACRAYASKHLRINADIINVKYEGQRTDGTHAVNGSAETSPPMTFQCSFNKAGTRIVRWVHDSPKGCPADVSEANRYLYPDC